MFHSVHCMFSFRRTVSPIVCFYSSPSVFIPALEPGSVRNFSTGGRCYRGPGDKLINWNTVDSSTLCPARPAIHLLTHSLARLVRLRHGPASQLQQQHRRRPVDLTALINIHIDTAHQPDTQQLLTYSCRIYYRP